MKGSRIKFKVCSLRHIKCKFCLLQMFESILSAYLLQVYWWEAVKWILFCLCCCVLRGWWQRMSCSGGWRSYWRSSAALWSWQEWSYVWGGEMWCLRCLSFWDIWDLFSGKVTGENKNKRQETVVCRQTQAVLSSNWVKLSVVYWNAKIMRTSSGQPRSTQSCRLRSKPLEHLRKVVNINVWGL